MNIQLLATCEFGILGLIIGSFLNVVIHRLPIMLQRQWDAEFSGVNTGGEKFNLMVPRSRCPSCSHQIRWFENIPVISYVALKGKCSKCKSHISVRYPLVELVTGALFFYCANRWGFTATALAWSLFCAAMVTLFMIDWDTMLLPDDITLPLLWAGLIASILGWTTVPLTTAVLGAIYGYLSLWLIYWAFKLATGKEGMGYGDFKLFAALGAWFGWMALVPIILLSAISGAVIGIAMKSSGKLSGGHAIPFGPFLTLAGIAVMIIGPNRVLASLGLLF